MLLKDYKENRLSIIPLKTLRTFKSMGVIKEPLERDDIIFLSKLELIWGKAEIVRGQMARWRADRRLSVAMSGDEPCAWQRFILARCFNLGMKGGKMSAEKLIEEAEEKYPSLKKEIYLDQIYVESEVKRLMKKANNLRYLYRKKLKGEGEELGETPK